MAAVRASRLVVWEKVSIEVEGPFPKTRNGNEFIVILTDLSSKWIEAKSLQEKGPRLIAEFVASTFARMGLCDVVFINVDRALEEDIRASIYAQCRTFFSDHGIYKLILQKIVRNVGSGVQQAVVERSFHTDKLLKWIAGRTDTWDVELEGQLFRLRTAASSERQSPFALMHGGRQLSAPAEGDIVRRLKRRCRSTYSFSSGKRRSSASVVKKEESACGATAAEIPTFVAAKKRGRPRKILGSPSSTDVAGGTVDASKASTAPCPDVAVAKNNVYYLRTKRRVKDTNGTTANEDEVVAVDQNDDEDRARNEANDSPSRVESGDDEKLTCSHCPLFTGNKPSELRFHESLHRNGSRLLRCVTCPYISSTWGHMQDHIKQHIETETLSRTWKGGAASFVSQTASRMVRRNELAGSQPYRCSRCVHLKMATKEEFQIHLTCHKEESKLLHCPYCGTVRGAWQQMQYHLGSHSEVPLEVYILPMKAKTCNKCGRVFPNPEQVYQHQMTFHIKDRSYQCETCGKTFKEKKSILRHQELHADIVYVCTECTYKTKIKSDFLQHERIHKGLAHTCMVCGRAFLRQSQLTLHMDGHRKNFRVAVCDQCGHQANGRAALWHHVRTAHRTPESWPCSLCSYVGKTKSNLNGHRERIHCKKFKCDQCDFGCLAYSTLVKHFDLLHNDEQRPYACLNCPYRAKEPKCLAEHTRVFHNPNAQKYPCEFCDATFKTKSMLRDHLPQHTGQRFVCKVCGHVAKYRSILYRHMKKQHSDSKYKPLSGAASSTSTVNKKTFKAFVPSSKRIRQKPSTEAAIQAAMAKTSAVMDSYMNATVIEEGAENEVVVESNSVLITSSDLLQATTNAPSDLFESPDLPGAESVIVDNNGGIVLHSSMFANSSDGQTITLPNNMYLQIIQQQQMSDEDEGGGDQPLELLLVASSGDLHQTAID